MQPVLSGGTHSGAGLLAAATSDNRLVDEYDPARPNEYEAVRKERERHKEEARQKAEAEELKLAQVCVVVTQTPQLVPVMQLKWCGWLHYVFAVPPYRCNGSIHLVIAAQEQEAKVALANTQLGLSSADNSKYGPSPQVTLTPSGCHSFTLTSRISRLHAPFTAQTISAQHSSFEVKAMPWQSFRHNVHVACVAMPLMSVFSLTWAEWDIHTR